MKCQDKYKSHQYIFAKISTKGFNRQYFENSLAKKLFILSNEFELVDKNSI